MYKGLEDSSAMARAIRAQKHVAQKRRNARKRLIKRKTYKASARD